MMNRNYQTPAKVRQRYGLFGSDIDHWADARKTNRAVAYAIFAIADSKRAPEEIWMSPTRAEFDAVTSAVEEYLIRGDLPRKPDDRYPWGAEKIKL
jgi:hypothetical protein